MKVLVTGANGQLGRQVVDALARRGHRVRALVRPSATVARWAAPAAIELFRADLRCSERLEAALEGVDAVIHLAACVAGSERRQFADTVVGTERLLEAMQRSAVRRLVLASTCSVYDWRRVGRVLDEGSGLEPDLYARDGYAITKTWQERLVRRRAEADPTWRVTVLRPGFIWGRGSALVCGIGQPVGRWYIVIGPFRRMPLTHVVNCADCFVTALEREESVGEVFNVMDGHRVSVWSYARHVLRDTGTRTVRVPLPYHVALAGVRLAWVTARVFLGPRTRLPSLFVPRRFEARFRPARFPNTKLKRRLGWEPLLSFPACLQRTFDDDRAVETTMGGAVALDPAADLGR